MLKVLLRSGKFDDVLNLIRESGVTIDHNKFVYDGLAPLHIASAAGALVLCNLIIFKILIYPNI